MPRFHQNSVKFGLKLAITKSYENIFIWNWMPISIARKPQNLKLFILYHNGEKNPLNLKWRSLSNKLRLSVNVWGALKQVFSWPNKKFFCQNPELFHKRNSLFFSYFKILSCVTKLGLGVNPGLRMQIEFGWFASGTKMSLA